MSPRRPQSTRTLDIIYPIIIRIELPNRSRMSVLVPRNLIPTLRDIQFDLMGDPTPVCGWGGCTNCVREYSSRVTNGLYAMLVCLYVTVRSLWVGTRFQIQQVRLDLSRVMSGLYALSINQSLQSAHALTINRRAFGPFARTEWAVCHVNV